MRPALQPYFWTGGIALFLARPQRRAPWHLPLDLYGISEETAGYHHSALLLGNLEQQHTQPYSTGPRQASIPPRRLRTRP